jgi:hypothetical protein
MGSRSRNHNTGGERRSKLEKTWFRALKAPGTGRPYQKPSCPDCCGTGVYGRDSKTKEEFKCHCARDYVLKPEDARDAETYRRMGGEMG